MTNPTTIETLRKFFRISNAAFDFAELIAKELCSKYTPSVIEKLHRKALIEIEKQDPDMTIIDALLAEMEEAATPKPHEFERGGVAAPNAPHNAIINPTDFS